MKKFRILALALLLLMVTGGGIFALSGNQKIYSVDSSEYKAIKALYLSQGLVEPSTSGPWSHDELVRMVDVISIEKLNEIEKETYDYVISSLGASPRFNYKDGLGANLFLNPNLELYVHTNKDEFTTERDWKRGFSERNSLLNLGAEVWATDHFYGYFRFGLGQDRGYSDNAINPVYAPIFLANIPIAFGGMPDLNQPNRAFVAAGGDHWSLSLGRDKTEWGNGESGNLMLGGDFPYHQYIRFATYFDAFKFTTLLSYFNHPGNLDGGQNATLEGMKLFLGHRLEFRVLNNKLGFAISESVMYQSKSNTFDIRIFNPFYVYHDLYMRGNANSLITLEANYALKNFNIYAQVAIDDFVGPGEPKAPAQSANPSAFGYILGAKASFTALKGTITASLEGAYTDPFLYLREPYDSATGQYGVGYDGLIRYNHSGAIFYDDLCVGYQYGPDALVVDLKASYDNWTKLHVGTEFMFMAHGVNDIGSKWSTYSGSEKVPHTPSAFNPFETTSKNKVSYTFRLSLDGSYKVTPRFSVNGEVDAILVLNKGNVEKKPAFDLQCSIGASYYLD